MTTVIWLGILVWMVLAVVIGLAVARMINLRDRQRPVGCEHKRSGASKPAWVRLPRVRLLSRIASGIRDAGRP
jgi:hypothetical protein